MIVSQILKVINESVWRVKYRRGSVVVATPVAMGDDGNFVNVKNYNFVNECKH